MIPQFMTGLLLALAVSVPLVGGVIRMLRELHGVNASRPYPHGLPLVPGTDEFILFWEPEADSIIFEMHARTLGWLGLGISKTGGMRQADIVMGWIKQDGTPVIQDRFATDKSLPSFDVEQDVELLGAHQTATHTMRRLRRPIKTCHHDDVTVETMTVRVIWAYGSSAPSEGEEPHYHRSARGVMSVSLLATGQENRDLPSDAFAWDLTVKNITIPKKDTTYWCLMAKVPERKHHMVIAFTVGNVSHVNISIVGLHTHLIGSALHVRHFRDGHELPPIAVDNYYDFNMQPFKVLDQEVVLQPNDDITVECYYDSTKRTRITTGGLTTRDEMCLAYFLYHPAIPLAECMTSPAEKTLLSFVGAEQQGSMSYYQMLRRIQQGLMVQNWGDAEVRHRFQVTVNGGDYKARCRGENIIYPIDRKTVRVKPRKKIMEPKSQCDGSSPGQANDRGDNGAHKSTRVASWLVSFVPVIFMLT